MTVMTFLLSVSITGVVATLIPVTPGTEEAVNADYHFVPSMGDAFGA